MIAGIVVGVLAVLAVAVLVVTVAFRTAAPSDDPVATNTPAPTTTAAPGVAGTPASQADLIAIRTAMQAFVDAVNSRNVGRIQGAVCSAVRPQVTEPLDITGNVVLEELSQVTVTGDSAESKVTTHLELGNQRSTTKQDDENFAREDGTWYVCPGAEPDIGT